MNEENTPPHDSSAPSGLLHQPCSGLGWGWNEETRSLTLYFEIEGGGAGIKMCYNRCKTRLSEAELAGQIAKIERDGFKGMRVRAMTPKQYEDEGYE